jgi:hypothetical protein
MCLPFFHSMSTTLCLEGSTRLAKAPVLLVWLPTSQETQKRDNSYYKRKLCLWTTIIFWYSNVILWFREISGLSLVDSYWKDRTEIHSQCTHACTCTHILLPHAHPHSPHPPPHTHTHSPVEPLFSVTMVSVVSMSLTRCLTAPERSSMRSWNSRLSPSRRPVSSAPSTLVPQSWRRPTHGCLAGTRRQLSSKIYSYLTLWCLGTCILCSTTCNVVSNF